MIRVTKTELKSPTTLEGTLRYQVWLNIGDRWLELGQSQKTHSDAQAIVVIFQRLMPDIVIDWDEWVVPNKVYGLNCPTCGKRGHRRHGVHFDHEFKCGSCDGPVWEPGAEIES